MQEEVLLLVGELAPGGLRIDLVAICDRLNDRFVEARATDRPRNERTVANRKRRIGHEQVGVDLLLVPEPHAPLTRAVRRVEREHARLELGKPDAVLGARESLREGHRLAVYDVDGYQTIGQRERGLDRVSEPVAQVGLHREPIDHHLDRVLELLVELDLLLEQPLLAVDLDAREALVAEALEEVSVLPLPIADDRRVDGELRPFREREHLVDDRLDGLARDGPPADRTVRPADARIEKTEVVVDLGDGADGRAGVPRRRLLVDRDRW